MIDIAYGNWDGMDGLAGANGCEERGDGQDV